MTGSPIFTLLAIASTAIFALGVVGNVFFWIQGSQGVGLKPASSGLAFLLGAALRGLGNPSVWRSLFLDTALQQRLWRLGKLRWLMQIGFIWGGCELFFVGSVGNMLAEKGILPLTKDTPGFATLNELGACLVLLSVGIALYRRFVAREIELPTSPGDALLIALLAVVVLSGILVEASRFLASGTPPAVGWYSFLGYAVAQLLHPLAADWSGSYLPLWWFHIVFSFSLVAYLPYSKLFHLFVSPAVLAAGATER